MLSAHSHLCFSSAFLRVVNPGDMCLDLDLRSNQLTKLASKIGNLRSLRVLKLAYNRLEFLPASILQLVNCKLFLNGNPWLKPPSRRHLFCPEHDDDGGRPPVPTFPKKRQAAVMVGLFASRQGHLNVLLTRRSKTMRTYAGETALPGGKMEPQDLSLEDTACRKAHEECGITLNRHKVRKLATLSPFPTRGNLIVTPIVFFIANQTLMPRLNAEEVDVLDVLIEVAVLGYGREPEFERKAAGQLSMSEIITIALREAPKFQSDEQAHHVAKHDILEDGPRSPLA
ncbi:hypothetical protein PTTG_25491 [Puccinia triticina 1-1 BBBD Race 1]|uniref:Nudix hydrolase domain-containing protein n=1 Tax=Puccinia triticina (isolate 1-1 / race 1 (BBBD)) TaxID=630390 RepID=A0A180H160_PUCT1|nr:hypothetical protein PTTG_25491 [Puccinia triticina 1-1 BBBD Race 1]